MLTATAIAIALAALVGVAGTPAKPPRGKPIIIGAAVDRSNQMAPVDGPALAAAQLEVKRVNERGGVLGRPVRIDVIDTQLSPQRTKTAASRLLDGGASVLWVSCDVDYATPAVQEALARGVLAIAPCIGTDQMGPKRFGKTGRLAFSFGNVAQDEGAAMAEYAYKRKRWKTAVTMTDNLLVYFKDVCKAFTVRFKELGGKIVAAESFTQGNKTVSNAVSRIARQRSDAIALCTAFGDLTTAVSGVRSLGDERPFIGPWSTDGSFWIPKLEEPLSNFYSVTFASVSGDDPSRQVRSLIAQLKVRGQAPVRGGFLPGADAVRAIVAVVNQTRSTDGQKLAAALERFRNFPAVSGPISFSRTRHTVYGRRYRVVSTVGGKRRYSGIIRASSPADIG